ASHAARCVACQGVRSHAVPVALVGECSTPICETSDEGCLEHEYTHARRPPPLESPLAQLRYSRSMALIAASTSPEWLGPFCDWNSLKAGMAPRAVGPMFPRALTARLPVRRSLSACIRAGTAAGLPIRPNASIVALRTEGSGSVVVAARAGMASTASGPMAPRLLAAARRIPPSGSFRASARAVTPALRAVEPLSLM